MRRGRIEEQREKHLEILKGKVLDYSKEFVNALCEVEGENREQYFIKRKNLIGAVLEMQKLERKLAEGRNE